MITGVSHQCLSRSHFLPALEFELRALHFIGRCSTTWTPDLSALVIFEMWTWVFAWGQHWTMILPSPPSNSWDYSHEPPHLGLQIQVFFLFLFSSLLVVVLGFELRALNLARQACYHLIHTLSQFCLGWFWVRVSNFCSRPSSDHDPPIYVSHVAGMTGVCHHAWFTALDRYVHLSMSTSWVAGITEVSHYAWKL
jgi:hypothetical protein